MDMADSTSATSHSVEAPFGTGSTSSSDSDSDLEGPNPELDTAESSDDDEASEGAVRHRQVREQSYALLEAARKEAQSKRNHNSTSTRDVMTAECVKRTGFTSYPEQLDLAECMLLGLDATCITPTGWGKTLPFVLPLFACPDKIT
ncbi:hypothetical protein C8Q80DRAFT_1128049 [Daedaleopsis nitida]|nr:hypothetical protein C8Q80DRAFT_1128049 [Daedaleopsis nitida]